MASDGFIFFNDVSIDDWFNNRFFHIKTNYANIKFYVVFSNQRNGE